MPSQSQARRNLVVIGLVAIIVSALFFVVIASGYFLLFRGNIVIATAAAIFFATIAVLISYWLGMQENWAKRYFPFFIFLLVISALGIFNSLMLNFQGRYIFTDAIEESQSNFQELNRLANAELMKAGVGVRLARIEGLRGALISEINNPLNCGQGPEARRLINELQRELPGFEPLSTPGVNCSRNEDVISDYNTKISSLVQRAAWNEPELVAAKIGAEAARAELQELYGASSSAFGNSLLTVVKPRLEALDDEYRKIYQDLATRNAVGETTASHLPLEAVRTLGEPSQFLNLIIARIGEVSTWLYFVLAVGIDWFMTYLWTTVRTVKVRPSPNSYKTSAGSAW